MTDHPEKPKNIPKYIEENIVPISPRDHIRRRPGMYFGGIDQRALHQTVKELVDNAIDEAISGSCNRIQVTLDDNYQITINDNGRGIPVETYQDTGQSVLELMLTKLNVRDFIRENKHPSASLFGAGIAAVNAVSTTLIVYVRQDGFLWQQSYQAGIKQTEVEQIRPLSEGETTGTLITFQPDFTIFQRNEFDYETLHHYLHELVFLVNGLTIILEDRRSSHPYRRAVFSYPDGILDFVKFLNHDRMYLHMPVIIRDT
ncbi:MAG TPA: ATP-binding protein, partial [Phototrophicaceae bacterium]|nr:ATP-binding protein [Phototrophicaceae bacterium]